MRQIKLGDRLRYAFDKSMSRGAIALMLDLPEFQLH
jgi:hypothetical protein